MEKQPIILKKVKVNNLKTIDLTLPLEKLIVFTGLSGSGKSSLAFDTIYVEGRRRYLEALQHSSRYFIKGLKKPDAEEISGLSATVAIEQKTISHNPRSTVGTMTGIYDFLRVLFARAATAYCPISKQPVKPQTKEEIYQLILKNFESEKILILAPLFKNKKGSFKDEFKELLKKGFIRVSVDNQILDLTENPVLEENKAHNVDVVIERLIIPKTPFKKSAGSIFHISESEKKLIEAIALALEIGNGFFAVQAMDQKKQKNFSEKAYCESSKISYPPLEPINFSFNHPDGMCPKCLGLGEFFEFDLDKIIDPKLSIKEGCCKIAPSYETIKYSNIYNNLARIYNFSLNIPWEKLSEKTKKIFLYGVQEKWLKMYFSHPKKHSRWIEYVRFHGIIFEAHKRLKEATSDIYLKNMHELMTHMVCPECKGHRLAKYPLASLFHGKKIFEITGLPLEKALTFFKNLTLNEFETEICSDLIQEITKRLIYLIDVGLGYLSLDRSSPTLSGGEAQRVRLASSLGTGLIGTTYILDEPSIGLHPEDQHRLIDTLKKLKNQGNTVIVVEHDRDTIFSADQIVDIGPAAGKKGGEIIAQGTVKDIMQNPRSMTGQYLKGEKKIFSLYPKRKPQTFLKITGARHNNLKNLDVQIPLGAITAVTGLSGSGKSSLISDTLFPHLSNLLQHSKLKSGAIKNISGFESLEKVILVDQSPIGRTVRSNPATYIKVLDEIRKLLSTLPESKIHGFKPGHFSFNVKEGSCPYCKGLGMTKIDMDQQEAQWETCPQCQGRRFSEEILAVRFKGQNIYDILNLEASDALELFANIPIIFQKLNMLKEVGLEYLHLGQSSSSLSGGEAQRIKLAKELSRPSHGRTIYILDEPTTGLHFADIQKLSDILQNLTEKGNTVILIEHNMEIVELCDWIIDLGPGAGEKGGKVVFAGPFRHIYKQKTKTAKALLQLCSQNNFLEHKKNRSQEKQKQLKENFSKKQFLTISQASQFNLKNLNLKIPLNKITVFSGPSGSGKTTLAFDTIYAEAQRRYIEAQPLYIRGMMKMPAKPKIKNLENLPATLALEQKRSSLNPRSTIGTMTEIYDHLRLLFAHLAEAFSPETGEKIVSITKEKVAEHLFKNYPDKKIQILTPIFSFQQESFEMFLERISKLGFIRIRLNGKYFTCDENIPFNKDLKNEIFLVIDRLIVQKSFSKRLLEALALAAEIGKNKMTIALENKDLFFDLSFATLSGLSYPALTAKTFSFNAEEGMCLECQGLGKIFGIDFITKFAKLSPSQIFYQITPYYIGQKFSEIFKIFLQKNGLEAKTAISKQKDKIAPLLKGGLDFISLNKLLKKKNIKFRFRGLEEILAFAAKHSHHRIRSILTNLMHTRTCPHCWGRRLNPLALNAKLSIFKLKKSYSIAELTETSLKNLFQIIHKLQVTKEFLKPIKEQILKQLEFLLDIGLGYLSLHRKLPTLSGGEKERIYLAKHLASKLTSCLYILDEPTIGLHPYHSDLLMQALKKLKKQQNTLILIEHEPQIIKEADLIYDFGPGAGEKGGKITASGNYTEILNNPASLTGRYLSQKKLIFKSNPTATEQAKKNCKNLLKGSKNQNNNFIFQRKKIPSAASAFIEIKNASLHNLKHISTKIPKSLITVVTGLSGSGKSSLISEILQKGAIQALKQKQTQIKLPYAEIKNLEKISKIVAIDQYFIGGSVRSDIATYSEITPLLRAFFAKLPIAKARGLKPRHFSSNHISGMCRTCWGLGIKKIDLQFLPPVETKCSVCLGYKLKRSSLEIKYKHKHLGKILAMTIEEAADFLSAFPNILERLKILQEVGLGYLKLKQDLTTLSGGESQRLKLAFQLMKKSRGKILYLFDEPTIGLHMQDINKLLPIFRRLTDNGHTVIIIEHNLDLMAFADYIIDMGPEAAEEGGKVICFGTPEKIIENKNSYTAIYLRKKFISLL